MKNGMDSAIVGGQNKGDLFRYEGAGLYEYKTVQLCDVWWGEREEIKSSLCGEGGLSVNKPLWG